ncbi:nuclear transport factor 2 family protein [Pseudonocardia sp. DLS-67]
MSDLRPTPGWARSCDHVRLQPPRATDRPDPATDRLLVAERIARYGWAYDERDREALAECFTPAGVWEGLIMGHDRVGPAEGREAIVDFLVAFWEQQGDQRRHVFTNVVVDELAPAHASAHAYIVLTAASGGVMNPVSTGPYRFELVRESDGIWRIARLSAGFDAPF